MIFVLTRAFSNKICFSHPFLFIPPSKMYCSIISSVAQYLCFHVTTWCGSATGTVKKAVGAISFIHDRSKTSSENLEEQKSAISDTRESKGTLSTNSHTVNPHDVLTLFRKMSDEVIISFLRLWNYVCTMLRLVCSSSLEIGLGWSFTSHQSSWFPWFKSLCLLNSLASSPLTKQWVMMLYLLWNSRFFYFKFYVYNGVSISSLKQDCELLNIADRPEKFIITTIAVPPIAIRPSVIMEGSQR